MITVAINCNITFNRQNCSLGDRHGALDGQVALQGDLCVLGYRNLGSNGQAIEQDIAVYGIFRIDIDILIV